MHCLIAIGLAALMLLIGHGNSEEGLETREILAEPLLNVTETAPRAHEEPLSAGFVSTDFLCQIKCPVFYWGGARHVGVRNTWVRSESVSGDANSERAVLKALRWLKATQAPDGSWGTKPELGLTKDMDKVAGVGFALLAFLAHRETPASREFGPTVEKALDYLINSVYVVKDASGQEARDPNGRTPYVRMSGAGGTEYGFLIGTHALCEAYGVTKNPNVRAAAELALARIISGQTPTGGWNYNMKCEAPDGAPDDVSFGGWALQALKAGQVAGIQLPGMDACIKKAIKCLKTRNYSEKAGFVYRATTNHKDGSGGLAGVGCLAKQLFGYASEPEVENALRVMADWVPTLDKTHMSGGANAQYYSYYATQCKCLAGMAKNATPATLARWKKWNVEMKTLYSKAIVTVRDPKTNRALTVKDANGKSREIGHWVIGDHYNYDVMGTCLVALQLMAYYSRPFFPRIKGANVEIDAETLLKDHDGEVEVSIDL